MLASTNDIFEFPRIQTYNRKEKNLQVIESTEITPADEVMRHLHRSFSYFHHFYSLVKTAL